MNHGKRFCVIFCLSIAVCLSIIVLSLHFMEGQTQAKKSGWLTHKGIIVNAYFQDISTSFGRRMKTIIVMKNKQLMFSDAWKGEIPLGVEVCIKEGRDGEIISIEEIEK